MSASAHTHNLGRAARLIKRMADVEGGPSEFEGVSLHELVADVLQAQNAAFMREAYERVGLGGGSPRSAPESNVIQFPDMHSRRVGA